MNYPNPDSTHVERQFQRQAMIRRMQDDGTRMAVIAIVVIVMAVVIAQIAIHYADAISFLLGGI